jgi:hypothetical protein
MSELRKEIFESEEELMRVLAELSCSWNSIVVRQQASKLNLIKKSELEKAKADFFKIKSSDIKIRQAFEIYTTCSKYIEELEIEIQKINAKQ